jgi:predicted transcriptional regulator
VGYIRDIHNDREPCMSFAVKESRREAVEQLPEDATFEDVMDRLYFLAKVARGLEAADRGEVVSRRQVRPVIFGDDADDAR